MEAVRITTELNSSYHTPEEIRELMSELTGKPVDETFRMHPPFYSDFGKNITLGKDVFINFCCCFRIRAVSLSETVRSSAITSFSRR